MAKKFTLTIQCDNAAFGDSEDDARQEIARILAYVAERIERGADEGACRDLNGNNVGRFYMEGFDDD